MSNQLLYMICDFLRSKVLVWTSSYQLGYGNEASKQQQQAGSELNVDMDDIMSVYKNMSI